MTPEQEELIRRNPRFKRLFQLKQDKRPWETLTLEERQERAEALRGILEGDGGSVDRLIAERRAEVEAEERKEKERVAAGGKTTIRASINRQAQGLEIEQTQSSGSADQVV